MAEREILNIDEAAELLGVSVKTFNKVLHSEDLPARKIGREWKFSRAALIAWVGSGKSRHFYRESDAAVRDEAVITAAPRAARLSENGTPERARARRTAGWQIEE
jgi:excisionase family DNA binding protein